MARLQCLCGNTLSNVSIPNQVEHYVLSDGTLDAWAGRDNISAKEIDNATCAQIWKCSQCGRLAWFDDPQQTAPRWFEPRNRPSRLLTAICDYHECSREQQWDASDPEYAHAPERWGFLELSDACGELQAHWLCPEHVRLGVEAFRADVKKCSLRECRCAESFQVARHGCSFLAPRVLRSS